MKIIIINGAGGAGKDSFVESAIRYAEKEGNLFIRNLSCVTLVKAMAYDLGWNGKKDEKGRRFLSDIKDALERYNDAPFQDVLQHIINFLSRKEADPDHTIIFIHVREPKDIARWVKETDAKTLLIRRAGIETFNNHADQNVYDYDYDFTYVNDGSLDKLEQDAIDFIKWIDAKSWESHLPMQENYDGAPSTYSKN